MFFKLCSRNLWGCLETYQWVIRGGHALLENVLHATMYLPLWCAAAESALCEPLAHVEWWYMQQVSLVFSVNWWCLPEYSRMYTGSKTEDRQTDWDGDNSLKLGNLSISLQTPSMVLGDSMIRDLLVFGHFLITWDEPLHRDRTWTNCKVYTF